MEFLMHSAFFFKWRACYLSEEKSGGSQKLFRMEKQNPDQQHGQTQLFSRDLEIL